MKYKKIYYNGYEYTIPLKMIRIFRQILGVSQGELGKELGLTREAISNWEFGWTDYNYKIQTWYLKKGLITFIHAFDELLETCNLRSLYFEEGSCVQD